MGVLDARVTDGKLVTASGIAPLEFTKHVLEALDAPLVGNSDQGVFYVKV